MRRCTQVGHDPLGEACTDAPYLRPSDAHCFCKEGHCFSASLAMAASDGAAAAGVADAVGALGAGCERGRYEEMGKESRRRCAEGEAAGGPPLTADCLFLPRVRTSFPFGLRQPHRDRRHHPGRG